MESSVRCLRHGKIGGFWWIGNGKKYSCGVCGKQMV